MFTRQGELVSDGMCHCVPFGSDLDELSWNVTLGRTPLADVLPLPGADGALLHQAACGVEFLRPCDGPVRLERDALLILRVEGIDRGVQRPPRPQDLWQQHDALDEEEERMKRPAPPPQR